MHPRRHGPARRRVRVEVLSISGEPVVVLELYRSTTLKRVKQEISQRAGVNVFRQRLVHTSPDLDLVDRMTLGDLQHPVILTLVVVSHLQDEETAQQLLRAVSLGDRSVTECLLHRAACPDSADSSACTPLHIASEHGHADVVRLLCDAWAEKDATQTDGLTSLSIAASNGHCEVMRILLNAGADPDRAASNGATPLHHAAANGHLEAVLLLCTSRADANKAALNGATALHNAAYNGHPSVVQMLCNMGVDRYKRTKIGATPGIAAARNGHLEVLQVLCRSVLGQMPESIDGFKVPAQNRATKVLLHGAVPQSIAFDLMVSEDSDDWITHLGLEQTEAKMKATEASHVWRHRSVSLVMATRCPGELVGELAEELAALCQIEQKSLDSVRNNLAVP